jgi:hypothetical protein
MAASMSTARVARGTPDRFALSDQPTSIGDLRRKGVAILKNLEHNDLAVMKKTMKLAPPALFRD